MKWQGPQLGSKLDINLQLSCITWRKKEDGTCLQRNGSFQLSGLKTLGQNSDLMSGGCVCVYCVPNSMLTLHKVPLMSTMQCIRPIKCNLGGVSFVFMVISSINIQIPHSYKHLDIKLVVQEL